MKNFKIRSLKASEILDSRGNPTLRVLISTKNNTASFDVPSGASTGIHEAHELRDGDDRFGGKGVLKAVKNVNEIIAPELLGRDCRDQEKLDAKMLELDGTDNKSKLGGNAIIGVSVALVKLASLESNLEIFEYLQAKYDTAEFSKMPRLYMNMINGGAHSQSPLAFQEYMIVPKTESPREALEISHLVQKKLKKEIKEKLGMKAVGIGDEGGYVLDTDQVEKPLELFTEILKKNKLEGRVEFSLDVAASSFYNEEKQTYFVNGKNIDRDELLQIYKDLCAKYPMLSMEDPFWEENFTDFAMLKGGNCIVVGDDLTVTNKARLETAIGEAAIDALIIKPNQIGTITETVETMNLAKEKGISCIMSHRSGDTIDSFISDMSYAFGCFGIKAGALQRGERIAKYNRFLEIERLVKNK